jgi:hypothetical protein
LTEQQTTTWSISDSGTHRVASAKVPFDHPQLFVPNGHEMRDAAPVVDRDGTVRDLMLEIPAVGRNGGPLPAGFLE